MRIVSLSSLTTTYTGAHIAFSGAVWTTRPNMQVLSPVLPLFWHHTDTTMRVMAARYFGALRKAISSLEKHYNEMLSDNANFAPLGEFPYPCSYTCIKQSLERQFTYINQLDKTKLVFSAKTTDNEVICVKFVRRYSKKVHEFCAGKGFAPELKAIQYQPGGWHMVVMEMIPQEYRGLDLSVHYPYFDDIRAKLDDLHQNHFVHGDLRDTNIMVKVNGAKGFKLLDFDWSGTINRVRYPENVNRDLWRPVGAVDEQLIMPEHDMAMLQHMIETNY